MIEDLPVRYQEYLDRFAAEVGVVKTGAFAKFAGRLIKKLSFEDFTPAFLEYTEMAEQYLRSVANGDTVNDIVLRLLRDQAANLVMKPPG